MKHYYKTILASITMLVLHVTMVMGASITYSLTTHVDHRTITATANLNSGANLNANMPQALWRVYCTYKYYSDQAKTQEITTAPATESTVYVDYVFEPPFTVSEEGAEMYYLFNGFIFETRCYMYENLAGKTSSGDHAKWALYGDSYSFNLKNYSNGQWITYDTSNNVAMANAKMETGWQLYHSWWTRGGKVEGTILLATAHNDNMVLNFYEAWNTPSGYRGMFRIVNITSELSSWGTNFKWDAQHKFVRTNTNVDQGGSSNISFFFTYGTYWTLYHTTWRLLKADGTWIEFTKQKDGNYPRKPFWPRVGETSSDPYWYPEKPYCTYDRYYKDDTFAAEAKYGNSETMPKAGNTVLYIRENLHGELYSDHWITLVLSFDLDGENNHPTLGDWFGTLPNGKPAVRVLEYTALTTNKENTKYALTFTETNVIKKHKPYLFKADEVLVQDGNYLTYFRDGTIYNQPETDLNGYVDEGKVYHNDIHDGVQSPTVTMIGTYLDKVLTTPSNGNHPDLLYFYFGYDKRYDPASSDYVGETEAEGKQMYNFYRVTSKNVTIKPNKCYFMIEGAPAGAKFMLMDNFGNEITSVEGIDADSFIQTTGRIYNLNGQMMGTDLQSLPRGIYIVNGKKVMK